ncbi:MAG: NADAR family protein [Planctomycetota bacterium]
MTEPIKFYRSSDAYGEFSNFAVYPIHIGDRVWPSTEHYYQAMKLTDILEQEEIRAAYSPKQAALMGRAAERTVRDDWESTKVNVMRDALMAKFTQHEELSALLRGTGDAQIIETSASDDYWGDGGDGKGKNMLGRVLMEVRAKLREQSDVEE